MVKENTHIYIAHKVLDKNHSSVLFSHIKEYYLGSIIADAFNYSKNTKKVSDRLHGKNGEKTSDIIFEGLDYAKDKQDERTLAFILGFVVHATADIVFHPMIISKAKKSRHMHFLIETYIDKMFNDSYYVHEVVYPKLVDGTGAAAIFSKYLEIDEKHAGKLIKKLIKRQILVESLLKNTFFYWIASLLNKHTDFPYVGLFYSDKKQFDLKSYIDPLTGKKVDRSIDTLMDNAIILGQKMIKAAHDYYLGNLSRKQCEKSIRGESLITGKTGIPYTKMKHFG